MLPHRTGRQPDRPDEAPEVHLDARLVAVGGRDDHALAVGVGLEDGADGAVDLRVHEHQVLAVADGVERHVRTELDGAGHLDDGVDALGATQQRRVVGHGLPPRGDGLLHLGNGAREGELLDAGLAVGALGLLRRAVADRHQLHPGDRVLDLIGDAAPHEPRSHHRDADGATFLLAALERRVDDDHGDSTLGW
jgi:hypothetical protein